MCESECVGSRDVFCALTWTAGAPLCSYIHVLMVFWSFLAGVATFYCSIGPETLLPSVFFSLRAKKKVRCCCMEASGDAA